MHELMGCLIVSKNLLVNALSTVTYSDTRFILNLFIFFLQFFSLVQHMPVYSLVMFCDPQQDSHGAPFTQLLPFSHMKSIEMLHCDSCSTESIVFLNEAISRSHFYFCFCFVFSLCSAFCITMRQSIQKL